MIIAPLFSITFATFETLQRIWAPGTRNKVDILEDDFESMRKARVQSIAGTSFERLVDFLAYSFLLRP